MYLGRHTHHKGQQFHYWCWREDLHCITKRAIFIRKYRILHETIQQCLMVEMHESVTCPEVEDRVLLPPPCHFHTSLSIVVDEAEPPAPQARSPSPSAAEEAEEEESSRSGPRQQQQLTKQKSDERLRQIQGEVENRRSEFARLLEEHAQVVARLKAIESSAAASPV